MSYRNTASRVEDIINQHFWDYSMHAEFYESVQYLENYLTEAEMLQYLQTALTWEGTPNDDSHPGRVVILMFLKLCWDAKRADEAEMRSVLGINK